MNTISECPSFNPSYTDLDLPTDPLDLKILNLLVRHALKYAGNFYGLSLHNVIRTINGYKMRGGAPKFTLKEIGEVRRALLTLERNGLAYQIKRSRSRWFPSSRGVALHGIAEGSQTSLEKWVV
ncbi:hypothetical protein ES703_108760 [subsurface metagenome]